MAKFDATFDLQPYIDQTVKRAAAVMDTAARDEVISWLRAHGYTVTEPASCICYSTRSSRCSAHETEPDHA